MACELPGYERVTWMSSLLPVMLLALQPLIEQWPTGEIDSATGDASNYYPGTTSSSVSAMTMTSGSGKSSGKGGEPQPSEDRFSKMKSKSKAASSKKKSN